MSKRFVDTNMYSKAWFRKLKPKHKCLWEWLRLHCDHAGVVDLDIDLVSFQIGEEIKENDLNEFGKRLEKISENKYWIVDFVKFQYGDLKENYNPHKPVIKSLKKHGLFLRVEQGLSKTSPSLMDKDIYKDKDKDKDKDKETEYKKNVLEFSNDLFDNVIQAWNNHLAGHKAFKHIRGLKPSSRDNFFEVVSHAPELKKISTWQECFELVKNIPFYNGENDRGFVCTLDWLLESGKIVDVLNGKFDSNKNVSEITDENLDQQYQIYLQKKKSERIARGVENA